MEKVIESCLEEVSKAIMQFLIEQQGGESNGYLTYVNGVVETKEKPKPIEWSTPKAKEELTKKGNEIRGTELYKTIQDIIKRHEINSITIRSRDEGYGAMHTEVVFIQETKKSLPYCFIQ